MENPRPVLEYRVRPVTRYIVTRYAKSDGDGGPPGAFGVTQRGEFDNFEVAYEVAYALCADEHARLGLPLDDERVQYPVKPVASAPSHPPESVSLSESPEYRAQAAEVAARQA